MQNVTAFEAKLLRLLYYFLRREPPERALPLVEATVAPPRCLSRGAVRLVQEALAKGCTFLLAQRGGWREERYLRGEKAVSGRLWERTPPAELGLKFSRQSMTFLIWITSASPRQKEGAWQPAHDQLTPADLLLLFYAHEGLREAAEGVGAANLRKRAPYSQHGLCWLAYPEDFVDVPAGVEPNWAPWTSGLGACMLEAMQHELTQRWVAVEGTKERMAEPARMRALGHSQDRVLQTFLSAAEKAGRRDLARFLLRAASQLLGPVGGEARQALDWKLAPAEVSARLDVLDILPRPEMVRLLTTELQGRGFQKQGNSVVRVGHDVTVSLALTTFGVSARLSGAEGAPEEERGARARRTEEESEEGAEEQAAEEKKVKVHPRLGSAFRRSLGAELEEARDSVEAEALRRKASTLVHLWTGSLQMAGQRLADRAATYQAALAFLRALDRLAGWARWARSVGYFDEEYASAQLWLGDWEQYHGDALHTLAQAIIRNLDPMRQAAS